MKIKIMYTSALIAVLIVGCKSGNPGKVIQAAPAASEISVIKPLPGFELKPRIFTVSATQASKIELPNGGSISFPENAFTDATGNPIKGNVNIEWQEFHSLTDIMVSGIPMTYDSAGVSNQFISGGMFTIGANQNGKKIELAKGKEATVALASYDTKPSYNFYSLDDKTGKWSYEKTDVATPNPKAKNAIANAEKKKENRNVFLDIALPVDAHSFPELANKDIVGWEVSSK